MKCDSKQPEARERAQRRVDKTSVGCVVENWLDSAGIWSRTHCGHLEAKRPCSKRPPPARPVPLCSLETFGRAEDGSHRGGGGVLMGVQGAGGQMHSLCHFGSF